MKMTKEHQLLLCKIVGSEAKTKFLVKEIKEQRDRELSQKSIQAVKEMMLVIDK